ncbi:MAG: phosphoenolpyruvate--protein phosphotransferase [Actinomycetaceae bacterium]|nr:phosphoenolpyruvate--protein phosphotransferase [Actinomycetaceae bacterium]
MNKDDSKTHIVYGTPVVDGIAYAPVAWTRRPGVPDLTAPDLPESERDDEIKRFTSAANDVVDNLHSRAEATTGHAAALLEVAASIAADPAWRKNVQKRIARGIPAVQATMAATDQFVTQFERQGGIMAERTTDLRDVRDRVIARLEGRPEPGVPHLDHPVVLFADDLSPADTAGLDPNMCVALVTELGGPTSHTSIIARQHGIPCIVAARKIADIEEGTHVLVDGLRGTIQVGVDEDDARHQLEADRQRIALIEQWEGPAATKDGKRVELLANVRDGETAQQARKVGAEGIGLLRTELCFLESHSEPSVEVQRKIYEASLTAFPGQKVVVRTLDAGSDKPVPYATLQEEANPALGVRGLRTSGPNPNLLLHQLDAIAEASRAMGHEKTWVMAPMVSTLPETKWFASLVRERGMTPGIMVEVPSVAIMAERFMELVDFVSIGTNDLTQYTMAADRLSPDLAEYSDPWQPAALNLVARVAAAGKKTGTPVGVCGEAAADPLLACVLVGMGVTSLSVSPSAIKAVGAQLSQFTMEQCEAAARAVSGAWDQGDARHRVRQALNLNGIN